MPNSLGVSPPLCSVTFDAGSGQEVKLNHIERDLSHVSLKSLGSTLGARVGSEASLLADAPAPTTPVSSFKRSSSFASVSSLTQRVTTGTIDGLLDTDLDQFLAHMVGGENANIIIVDCTDSDEVARRHPSWLLHGAHVVTASKRGIAGPLALYHSIADAVSVANRMYMSEVRRVLTATDTITILLVLGDTCSIYSYCHNYCVIMLPAPLHTHALIHTLIVLRSIVYR